MIGQRQTVEQVQFSFVNQLHNELSEDGIGPCHPATGEFLGIVFMERLMNEAQSGVCVHDLSEAFLDFVIALAGRRLHNDAHGPNHVVTNVWSADSFAYFTSEEVRIVFAPHKLAGILIDGVGHRKAVQEG